MGIIYARKDSKLYSYIGSVKRQENLKDSPIKGFLKRYNNNKAETEILFDCIVTPLSLTPAIETFLINHEMNERRLSNTRKKEPGVTKNDLIKAEKWLNSNIANWKTRFDMSLKKDEIAKENPIYATIFIEKSFSDKGKAWVDFKLGRVDNTEWLYDKIEIRKVDSQNKIFVKAIGRHIVEANGGIQDPRIANTNSVLSDQQKKKNPDVWEKAEKWLETNYGVNWQNKFNINNY